MALDVFTVFPIPIVVFQTPKRIECTTFLIGYEPFICFGKFHPKFLLPFQHSMSYHSDDFLLLLLLGKPWSDFALTKGSYWRKQELFSLRIWAISIIQQDPTRCLKHQDSSHDGDSLVRPLPYIIPENCSGIDFIGCLIIWGRLIWRLVKMRLIAFPLSSTVASMLLARLELSSTTATSGLPLQFHWVHNSQYSE